MNKILFTAQTIVVFLTTKGNVNGKQHLCLISLTAPRPLPHKLFLQGMKKIQTCSKTKTLYILRLNHWNNITTAAPKITSVFRQQQQELCVVCKGNCTQLINTYIASICCRIESLPVLWQTFTPGGSGFIVNTFWINTRGYEKEHYEVLSGGCRSSFDHINSFSPMKRWTNRTSRCRCSDLNSLIGSCFHLLLCCSFEQSEQFLW